MTELAIGGAGLVPGPAPLGIRSAAWYLLLVGTEPDASGQIAAPEDVS
ncbi:hypothetical protein [Streptomyces sp. NPDC058045]